MMTRKGHMDLMCHKRSPQNESPSRDNQDAPGSNEQGVYGVLDDFTWERVQGRQLRRPFQDSQGSTHHSHSGHETTTPSTRILTESGPLAFQEKQDTNCPRHLSQLRSGENSPTEPAYQFMLDSDFVFELGEHSEGSNQDSNPSKLETGDLREPRFDEPVPDTGLGQSKPDDPSVKTLGPNVSHLGNDCAASSVSEIAAQKQVDSHPASVKNPNEALSQTKIVSSSEKSPVSSPEPSVESGPSFDPTFDPNDFSFAAKHSPKTDVQNTWAPSAESLGSESGERSLLKYVKPLSKKQVLIPLILIMSGIVLLYPSNPKPYSVETRLFFITLDGKSPERSGWSVDREIRHFNNTNILYACAQKLFGTNQDVNGVQGSGKLKGSNPTTAGAIRTVADGRERFKSSGDFIKWFLKSSSLDADGSSVPARIALRLAGHDPAFLKAVSENYVRAYVDYRRTVQSPEAFDSKGDSKIGHPNSEDSSVKAISERLKNFDIQEREYELALRLLDSGKSPFSGFIPKDSMVEPGSLVNFQQKIVQLEINKNSLLTRFAPESREVRSVEEEIQAVREGMRQCVIEQLRFVKQNKEMLVAQKSGPEKVSSESAETKPSVAPPTAVKFGAVNRDNPIFIADGLYLLWDNVSVVDKPFSAKLGDFFKERMVGNMHRSVDNVRGLKDSVVTGIYQSLVSEDNSKADGSMPSDLEEAALETGSSRRANNSR